MVSFKKTHLGLAVLVITILLSSCGPSPEELAKTSAAETASADTITPIPSSTKPPTSTPRPIPSSSTPTPTATTSMVEILIDQLSGDFDYFILGLAWEPDYCAISDNPDPQSCTPGLKLGFVLHGLWPSYYVDWPSYCSTVTISNELITEFPGLFPTDFLYHHEWEKHGTCTGLDPEEYFLLSQELKQTITIPEAFISPEEPFRMDEKGVIDMFVAVNPAYNRESFTVYCSGGGDYLSELYVCISKDGEPTECGSGVIELNAESCGQPDFLVRSPQ